MALQYIDVDLVISARDYQLYYRQPGTQVRARSTDGRRVLFPASLLQRFVGYGGIQGRFRIEFDSSGRCREIQRLG